MNQLTPFTCGLACIESVAVDFGIVTSQAQMLVDFKAELLIASAKDVGDFGVTSAQLMEQIWTRLGIKGTWSQNNAVPAFQAALSGLQNNQAVLVISNFQSQGGHCARYDGLLGSHGINLILPVFLQPQPMHFPVSFVDLLNWNYAYAILGC